MNRRNALPTYKDLHVLFAYKDGVLYWKTRPPFGRVKTGDTAGYKGPDGYVKVGINGVYYMAHRLIWRMHHKNGAVPIVIDHVDGNKSNNKIENLRALTHSDNIRNQTKGGGKLYKSTGKLKRLLGE